VTGGPGQHYGLANSVALSDGLTRYDRWLQDAVAHVRQIMPTDNYGCWWYFDTPVRYEHAVGSTKADRAFSVRDCCAFYISRQRFVWSIHFLESQTGFALGVLQQFCAELLFCWPYWPPVIGTTICTSVRKWFLCDPALNSRNYGMKFVFVLNIAVDCKGVPASCAETVWRFPPPPPKGVHFKTF
jgi:hypothetical protein